MSSVELARRPVRMSCRKPMPPGSNRSFAGNAHVNWQSAADGLTAGALVGTPPRSPGQSEVAGPIPDSRRSRCAVDTTRTDPKRTLVFSGTDLLPSPDELRRRSSRKPMLPAKNDQRLTIVRPLTQSRWDWSTPGDRPPVSRAQDSRPPSTDQPPHPGRSPKTPPDRDSRS